jgi:hypothetical protein
MGRQRWSRLTVEQCPIQLCVTALYRGGMFDAPPYAATTTLTWPGLDGLIPSGRIKCHLVEGEFASLRISIPAQRARPDYPVEAHSIPLVTTRPHLGGKRFWFLCGCGRRAGRLYLPPGQRQFRCRGCYGLTYRSAQRHDQRRYDLARNFAAMEQAIESKKIGRALLGVSAFVLRFGWEQKGRFCSRQLTSPS